VNGEQLGVTFIETNPKGGEPGRQCLPGRSEPAPVSRPGTMNLGTACADTWYRDFAISLPGLEAAACDHLSRRRFCFRSLCQAVSWSGSSVPECGRHRPPVVACSRTSLLDPGSPRPRMGLVEHVSLYEDRLRIPVWNRRAGDHQPEDNQHGCERRKSKGEPPSKELVIPGRQLGFGLYRTDGKIAHLHLHPHHR
jgi:hypothetical protein